MSASSPCYVCGRALKPHNLKVAICADCHKRFCKQPEPLPRPPRRQSDDEEITAEWPLGAR